MLYNKFNKIVERISGTPGLKTYYISVEVDGGESQIVIRARQCEQKSSWLVVADGVQIEFSDRIVSFKAD